MLKKEHAEGKPELQLKKEHLHLNISLKKPQLLPKKKQLLKKQHPYTP